MDGKTCDINRGNSKSTFSIRRFEAKDAALAAKMSKVHITTGLNSRDHPMAYARVVAWSDSVLSHFNDMNSFVHVGNGGSMFTAVTDDQVLVGTIGVVVSDEDYSVKRAELVRFYVLPEYRGRGIGQLLMNYLIRYVEHELGMKVLWMETLSCYERARAMYQKYGFVETNRERIGNQDLTSDDYTYLLTMEKRF